MAKISLRNYNREIGTLIDQGQLEEAVGHCNHILKTFPKHIETYQLLGKAYLEAKRYQDASDVFSRLLAAVPNDFVAHVGMSMIHDEAKRLDEAIWHMERAFEAQPSNAAVQSELQRLYGRRDGVQPPKIRMTSGALANVYIQGELYPQAIAEIMSVEAKDPGRADMQVLLAQAYYHSGQRIEASKIATEILTKSPYNLDANRILVEILPETSRAESTQVDRHRVISLDPYAAFSKSSVFNTSDVPDAAVSLERLDWQPGDTTFSDAGSISDTSIQKDSASGEQPDWLKNAETNADPEPATASAANAEPADDIPDFMRAAGWGTSSGEAEEPTSFFDSPDPVSDGDDDDDTPIAQGELPDWMKNIAPDQAELEAANEEIDEMDDAMADDFINDLLGNEEDDQNEAADELGDLSDLGDLGNLGTSSEEQDAAMNWLESLAANQGANPEELITDPNARTENAPDWVEKAKGASTAEPTVPQAETPPAEEPAAELADDMPDWLDDLGDADDEEATAASADDMPDWLGELGGEDDDEESAEDLPDWLSEDTTEETQETQAADPAPLDETPTEAIADAAIGTLGTSSDEQDAAMNWLESLAANQGANPEELITDPNARTENAPAWVERAKDATTAEPTVPQAETSPAEEPAAEPAEEEILEPAEESTDAFPAWLEDTDEEDEILPEEPAAEEKAETSTAEAVADETIGTLGTSSDDQDAAMNWLESLAANQGANPEELITDPNARTENAPDWVEKAKDVSAAKSGTAAEEAAPVEEEAPADAQETPVMSENELESDEDDVPAWLRDDDDEAEEDVPAWLRDEEDDEDEAVEAPATSMSMQDHEMMPADAPVDEAGDESEDEAGEEAWLAEQAQSRLAYEAPEPVPGKLPDIPAEAETESEEESVPEAVEEPAAEEAQVLETTDEEPPDWLKDMAAAEEAETAAGSEEAEEELPSWLSDMETDDDIAPLPVADSDDMPDWLKDAEEAATPPDGPEPTKAEEWKPVTEAAPQETEPEKKEEAESAHPPEKPTEKVEVAAEEEQKEQEEEKAAEVDLPPRRKVKRMNTTMLRDITLMSAQAAMREGNVSAALAEYGKLIKKKRLLDETIYDLREALYEYPVDVSIWQMLGDAYMRAGQLQEAINAYTQAEELLR